MQCDQRNPDPQSMVAATGETRESRSIRARKGSAGTFRILMPYREERSNSVVANDEALAGARDLAAERQSLDTSFVRSRSVVTCPIAC